MKLPPKHPRSLIRHQSGSKAQGALLEMPSDFSHNKSNLGAGNIKAKTLKGKLIETSSIDYDGQSNAEADGASSIPLDFSNWYAQISNSPEFITASDATAYDLKELDQANSAPKLPVTPEESIHLSPLTWAALGLVGAGGLAAAIANSNKNSGTADTAAPTIQSITANASSQSIELIFSEKLSTSALPLLTSFSVITNSAANAVAEITVSNNVMTLHLANPFTSGSIRIAYSDPSIGNDSNAIQDIFGNDASGFIKGIVADGYINGAQIYLDINGNGYADPNEATGIYTNTDGSFFLPSTLPNVAIIAVGGINIDTGLEQLTPLKAPAGSSTINPLTTLVLAVLDHAEELGTPITTEDAALSVARSLGLTLPNGSLLTTFDPLSGTDPDSLLVQKAAAQIATIINLTASSNDQLAHTIMGNLAAHLPTTNNETLDLGALDSNSITSLLADTGIGDTSNIVDQIVATNTAIGSADNLEAISFAQGISGDSSAISAQFIGSSIPDTAPPLPIRFALVSDTGASISDNISNNGLIRLTFNHSQELTESHTWRYTYDGGESWFAGVGESFVLPEGNYDQDQIQVKEVDLAQNATLNIFNNAITIDKSISRAALSFIDNGISSSDKITGSGLISIETAQDISTWAYSNDYGATWSTPQAEGNSFTLGEGSYVKNSIQVKQTDIAGNTSVSALESPLTINSSLADSNSVSPQPPEDTTPPALLYIVKQGASTLKLSFDQTLDSSHLPDISVFTITDAANGTSQPITSVSVDGMNLLLGLESAIGDRVLTVSYRDPSGNAVFAIQDTAGNDTPSFTQNVSTDSALIPYLEQFADTLINRATDVQFPIIGNLDLTALKEAISSRIQSDFSDSINPLPTEDPPVVPLLRANAPVLGWTSTSAEDIFDIDYTTKTFTAKFEGVYNFGDVAVADNLGYDFGSNNTLLKLGLNINADMALLWNMDLSLSGGWKENPLSANFDIWLDETVVDSNGSLSGTYIATTLNADLSSNSEISGNLGPLTATAVNTTEQNTVFDSSISNANLGTGLTGFINVLITDPDAAAINKTADPNTAAYNPGYNLSNLLDIGQNYQESFSAHYGVNSQISLEIATGLDFNSEIDQILPKLSFDLLTPLNLQFAGTERVIVSEDQRSGLTTAFDNDNNNGWVYLDNITVEVGDLINTIFNPILDFVDPVIQDLRPIVDFLQFDLIADLNANTTTGKDWFSELITNVTDAINWLPGPDVSLPTPVPTANQFVGNLLLDLYDQVDTRVGETGKVRIIDLMQGVVDQMNSALPTLEKAAKSVGGIAESTYNTVKDLTPYLEGTLVVMREVSDFLSSYYDFVEAGSQLAQEQYTLNLGTLAINIDPTLQTTAFSDRIDTSHLVMPWAFNGLNNDVQSIAPNSEIEQIDIQSSAPNTTQTAWEQTISLGGKIGLELPFLKDPVQFAALLMDQPANLVTFAPNFDKLIKDGLGENVNTDIQLFDLFDVAASIPSFSFLLPAAKFVDLPFKIRPDISIIPRIEAGIDNYALLNKTDPNISKWDGLYISDNLTTNSANQIIDLPELEATLGLTLKAFLGAGVKDVFYADVGAGIGITSNWALDLDDPNGDGKVRGSEILNLPNFSGSADWLVQIYGNLDTLLKDKSFTYTAYQDNLFNFDTKSVIPA